MNSFQARTLNPQRAMSSSLQGASRDEASRSGTFGTIEPSQSLMGNSAVAAAASNRSWVRSPPAFSSGGFGSSSGRQPAVGNSALAQVLGSTPIQAKLTVSQPGDAYEQEADRVADQVVSRVAGPALQRKCALCNGAGTCPKCNQGAAQIQRKSHAGESHEIESGTAAEIDRLRGGGQALSPTLRGDLEPQFGQDFGQVRVHTDGHAADLASAVGARAFTSGRDVVFGQGQYQPGSTEGQRLLAHELTHVVQQGAATPAGPASSFDGSGTHIARAGTQQIQRDWLDDAKAAASDAYDSAASTVGEGYDAAKSAVSNTYEAAASAVGAGATTVAEGAKAAVATISSAGQAVGSFVSDVGKTISGDPEKTRAQLIGQVNATQQKVQVAGPNAIRPDTSQIASMNQHISSLHSALPESAAAIPLVLPLVAPATGVGLGEVLAGIGAALAGAAAAEILIVVIIILAIIAIIVYLLDDPSGTFTKPKADPKADPKTDPKGKPKEDPQEDPKKKPGPEDPPPLPPEPDEIRPDCCKQVFQPTFVTIDKRHRRYGAKTIRVLDGRGKHSQNVKSNGQGASCDVAFLAAVPGQDPSKVGPCLRDWIAAVGAHDANYGGQMGSDSAPASAAIVKVVVENGVEINPTRYWGDAGVLVGVDIATGNATTMARIDDLPNKAHVIPQESKPT